MTFCSYSFSQIWTIVSILYVKLYFTYPCSLFFKSGFCNPIFYISCSLDILMHTLIILFIKPLSVPFLPIFILSFLLFIIVGKIDNIKVNIPYSYIVMYFFHISEFYPFPSVLSWNSTGLHSCHVSLLITHKYYLDYYLDYYLNISLNIDILTNTYFPPSFPSIFYEL